VPVLVGGVVRSALWGDMVVAFHPGPGREDVERRDAFQTAVFDSMCEPSNVRAFQLPLTRGSLAMGARGVRLDRS
jgi:hypothetical protein